MDITRIRAFYEKLGVAFPETQRDYPDFVLQQNSNWELMLNGYQSQRNQWSREWLKLDLLTKAKTPNKKAIEAQTEVVAEYRGLLDELFVKMLHARAREEVSRVLLDAVAGDEKAQAFLERQLSNAECYAFKYSL